MSTSRSCATDRLSLWDGLLGFLVPTPLRRRLDLIVGKVGAVQRRPPGGGAVISSLAIRPGGA